MLDLGLVDSLAHSNFLSFFGCFLSGSLVYIHARQCIPARNVCHEAIHPSFGTLPFWLAFLDIRQTVSKTH